MINLVRLPGREGYGYGLVFSANVGKPHDRACARCNSRGMSSKPILAYHSFIVVGKYNFPITFINRKSLIACIDRDDLARSGSKVRLYELPCSSTARGKPCPGNMKPKHHEARQDKDYDDKDYDSY